MAGDEIAPGVLQRGASPTAPDWAQLAQQSAPQPPDVLIEAILPRLGLGEAPPIAGERETDAFTWTLYEAEVSNDTFAANIDLAVTEADGTSYVVLMVATPEAYATLHESLFLPVVDCADGHQRRGAEFTPPSRSRSRTAT